MAKSVKTYLLGAARQLYDATAMLLERMEMGEEVSVKELKEAIAALKELVHTKEDLEQGEKEREEKIVKVTFEGEAEEWSK